jgi:hypothetical protein
MANFPTIVCSETASDPRVTGTATRMITFEPEIPNPGALMWNDVTLVGPKGSWSGTGYGVMAADGSIRNLEVMAGSGAYRGLVYSIAGTVGANGAGSWSGMIQAGRMPPDFSSGAAPSSAPRATQPSATTPVSSNAAESTDSIARQWIAALQAKDLEAMAALWAADGVWDDGATGEKFTGGPRAETWGWAQVLPTVIQVKGATVLALGDGAAVVTYTLYGPNPAHSTPIDVPLVVVLLMKDGLIAKETVYYNPKLAYG